ncbi:MAG TPA: MFS transporter, partial [Pseudobdellovibrionaceae bacterium]|nr:MFS transporter [Pseudobdellovibrionaceae bacterium]
MSIQPALPSTSIWSQLRQSLNATVLVAALGYFVDLFDITLFGVVRVQSLKDLGVVIPEETLKYGVHLYNAQMIGMMIGGALWGVLADRKGRLSVLFGSILLYSIGNIANAFVQNVDQYILCRFITGIGLAGELGAAITIVSESLPVHLRGIGTTFIATLGLSGSVAAAFFAQRIHWQMAYIAGGVMGLLLLVARLNLSESKLFLDMKKNNSHDGSWRLLFNGPRFLRYLRCILIGAPIYFITGILFTFSPELVKALGYMGEFSAANALMYGSFGLAIGDLIAGMLSQFLKSRKKAVFISLATAFALFIFYIYFPHTTQEQIYGICFGLGIAGGYWAVLITMAAEQFGTNIRGTVATTIPNFVRGSAVIGTSLFMTLKSTFTSAQAATYIGAAWFVLAFVSLFLMKETFSRNLDFLEE